ncbi:staphylopine family metallophore export MFS transporter CntE [Cohnella fermenti]|uniref:MFS transporter n=1 Tax=Cohnella fermenti TaxID=2565925 RepID=A0A4V3WFU0_9BACL|nr:MFS transporter [Cohnella fermenti]THF81668.1 MFS transporter [Cohnella fermenti]
MTAMTNRALSPPFLRLYALAFLFFSANAILNVILPLRSEALGASNGQIGLIMGAYMFTCMFFRPLAGQLIHKHGPASVLRILLIVNGLALVVYSFAGVEGYVAARMMQGICTAFFSMSLQIGIIDALPEEQRSQGVSLYSLFTYMPTIIGPLLAIGIWDWGGMGAFTVAMIAIALVTGLFGYSVPIQSAQPIQSVQPQSMGGSIRQLVRQRPLLVCSALMLGISVVFGAVTAFIPLYSKQVSGGHSGVFLMIQASVIVTGRFVFRTRIPSDGKWPAGFVCTVCLLASVGAMLLSLSLAWGPLAFYVAAVTIGVAQALLYPTLISYLSFVLPGAARNAMIGWFLAAADLGVSMGGGALGPVADRYSYSVMYGAAAGLAVLAACLVVLNRTDNRSRSE